MATFPPGDILGTALFGILLLSMIGVAGFIVRKLAAPTRSLTHRGLKIRQNARLPVGKVVLVDENWRLIGETAPDRFDSEPLPAGSAAAWFSAADFNRFEASKRWIAVRRPRPLQPGIGLSR